MNTLFTYIENAIVEIDSSFREHSDYFDFENIPKNKYNKSYHILNTSIVPLDMNGLHVEDNNNFEVRLYFKTKKNNRAEVISYLSVGKNIRDRLVDRDYSNTGALIKAVSVQSMANEYQESNDNALIIKLELNILTISNYKE